MVSLDILDNIEEQLHAAADIQKHSGITLIEENGKNATNESSCSSLHIQKLAIHTAGKTTSTTTITLTRAYSLRNRSAPYPHSDSYGEYLQKDD